MFASMSATSDTVLSLAYSYNPKENRDTSHFNAKPSLGTTTFSFNNEDKWETWTEYEGQLFRQVIKEKHRRLRGIR